ncbi:uncharacterized protein METZ01_LOCUS273719 [marine metagenome]|uniref:Uncharacterized protein n=1 Tax=marine metagenome TaxID=408172 RepID=A0A382KB55_9ZZZZ
MSSVIIQSILISCDSLGIDFTICFEYVNDILTALVDERNLS